MTTRREKTLHGDKRGAVLAEFVIAVVPLLFTFFCFVQVMRMQAADLALQHGAISGARAAIVITNNGGDNPGDNGDPGDVNTAVGVAMQSWADSFENIDVQVDDQSSKSNPYGPVTVKVNAIYQCNIPLGKLVCLTGGGFHTFQTAQATLPHQGARYATEN